MRVVILRGRVSIGPFFRGSVEILIFFFFFFEGFNEDIMYFILSFFFRYIILVL